jgi:hypothetical protein
MTDASTCELCGKKDWRVADGVCRECAPVVADLNARRERGLISNIDDAALPGERIDVMPRSGGSDTCAVCAKPFSEQVYGHRCANGTVIYLHDLCERRYRAAF